MVAPSTGAETKLNANAQYFAVQKRDGQMNKLDGKYSEIVQLPVKAKFRGFVANIWQHLPHLLLVCCTQQYQKV